LKNKRDEIIREIFATEITYSEALKLLVKVKKKKQTNMNKHEPTNKHELQTFVVPLGFAVNSRNVILTSAEISSIFSSIETIFGISQGKKMDK